MCWEYDENRPLGIGETGNLIRVTFWAHTNPFYNPNDSYACMIDVDTQTKDIMPIAPQGARRASLAVRFPASVESLPPTQLEECKNRLVSVLYSLDQEALKTGVIPDVPENLNIWITTQQAIEIADKVRKLEYDRGKPPHVSLINGVYVVTYWKTPEEIDVAWKRYAYRICIDAQTGKYLGMDYSSSAASKEGEGRPEN